MRYFYAGLCAVCLGLGLILLAPTLADAKICYVRDGGTATGSNGCDSVGARDWSVNSNVYDQLSSAEAVAARGDQIYVADGTYTGVTFNVANSGTTTIKVCKATHATVGSCATAHGTDTGWDSTMGDGTATFTSQCIFSSNYWIFDGVTGGGPGNWYGPFGFKVQVTAVSPALVLGAVNNFSLNTTGNSFRHVELQGDNNDTGGGSEAQDGVGGAWSRHTFSMSYFWTHDMGRTHWWLTLTDAVIEYGVTGRYNATDAQHSEIISMYGSVTGRLIIRYNLFTYVIYPSTGGLMLDTQDGGAVDVYGNVFWKDPALGNWSATNGGVINGWCGLNCPSGGNGSNEEFRNIFVYNNSFVNVNTAANGVSMLGDLNSVGTHSNANARNNLYYTIGSAGGGGWDVNSHNHFISTTSTGTNVTTGSGDPFANLSGLDFHLTAATPAGFDVGSGPTGCTAGVNCYNVDMYGTVRGADGTWDRGAVEFCTGGCGAGTPGLRFEGGMKFLGGVRFE